MIFLDSLRLTAFLFAYLLFNVITILEMRISETVQIDNLIASFNDEPTIQDRLRLLCKFLSQYQSALVAFSGGVDSSLLLAISSLIYEEGSIIGVTGNSHSLIKKDLLLSTEIAKKFNIQHITINTTEIDNQDYQANSKDRCYFCKSDLYSHLMKLKDQKRFDVIFDGTIFDDSFDYRPGSKAAKENGVESPLLESKFVKSDVRKIAKKLALPNWAKPATACLASRVAYGNKITNELLYKIELAEEHIKSFAFKTVRVRVAADLVRIEVARDEIATLLNNDIRESILAYLKSLGFKFVTVDLNGYQQGSFN
ncbi:MAG: ATP-dependent sacrificial sulfur transferase LarE [Nitrospinota bacterium]